MPYTFDLPSLHDTEEKPKLKTLHYDYENQEFVINSKGNIAVEDDEEAFKLWCKKAISIIRYSKMAYSNNLGFEKDPIDLYDSKEAKESWVKRTITEAIMSDPMQRAEKVDNFVYRYPEPDTMDVSFMITPKVGQSFNLEKRI